MTIIIAGIFYAIIISITIRILELLFKAAKAVGKALGKAARFILEPFIGIARKAEDCFRILWYGDNNQRAKQSRTQLEPADYEDYKSLNPRVKVREIASCDPYTCIIKAG